MSKARHHALVLKAAVLCDNAILEHGTGKWSLIGLWTAIRTPTAPNMEKPFVLHQMAIYFFLAEMDEGEYNWKVELIHLGNVMEAHFEMGGRLELKQGRKPVEFAVNLRGVPFHKIGKYIFRLTISDQYVGDKELELSLLKEEKNGNG